MANGDMELDENVVLIISAIGKCCLTCEVELVIIMDACTTWPAHPHESPSPPQAAEASSAPPVPPSQPSSTGTYKSSQLKSAHPTLELILSIRVLLHRNMRASAARAGTIRRTHKQRKGQRVCLTCSTQPTRERSPDEDPRGLRKKRDIFPMGFHFVACVHTEAHTPEKKSGQPCNSNLASRRNSLNDRSHGQRYDYVVCTFLCGYALVNDVTARYTRFCAGMVWSGLGWSGLVWSGLVWSGLVNVESVCVAPEQQGKDFEMNGNPGRGINIESRNIALTLR
ncbi:hypothetical protein DFH29DRAFT_1066720 [Suillus ampliporus]|nr:hypothetical protein DFH29DRAFT_1066720 [Suillus ampliporus]